MTVIVETEEFTIESFDFNQKHCIDCGELLPSRKHNTNRSGRCKKCHAKRMGANNKK